MDNLHWIILYDIKDVKRLHKVEKVMESYSHRVQKSVFECDAPSSIIEIVKKQLNYVIDSEEDFILFFNVCEKDWQKRELFGKYENTVVDKREYRIL